MPFGRKPQYVPPMYQRPPQAPAGPSVSDAINTGATREGQLSARIAKLEADIAGYKRDMQRNRPGTASHNAAKRRAVNALKQKKVLEAQATTVANSVFNLEQVQDVREQMRFQHEQVAAIKASHQMILQEQGKVDVDCVEDYQDDLTDAMADVNEVSETLARPYDVQPIDEGELLAELEVFEQEDVQAVASAPTPAYLTPAPIPGAQPSYQTSQPSYESAEPIPARTYPPQ